MTTRVDSDDSDNGEVAVGSGCIVAGSVSDNMPKDIQDNIDGQKITFDTDENVSILGSIDPEVPSTSIADRLRLYNTRMDSVSSDEEENDNDATNDEALTPQDVYFQSRDPFEPMTDYTDGENDATSDYQPLEDAEEFGDFQEGDDVHYTAPLANTAVVTSIHSNLNEPVSETDVIAAAAPVSSPPIVQPAIKPLTQGINLCQCKAILYL